ncbi:MAG: UDP-glucose 4-epimerase, partial [bacterium TMED15]
CEEILLRYHSKQFVPVIVRPATVCGYSPRLRLDLTVNILTNHAINKGQITVFGGTQKRPNIHIDDITDLYLDLLTQPDQLIEGRVWNVGYQNHEVCQIAQIVKKVVGKDNVEIVTTPSDDLRSYHISSAKIYRDIGFKPLYSIEKAVEDLAEALRLGKVTDPMNNEYYFNIRRMKSLNIG